MTSEIQWYIAREGKQYGPLSDPEMGLFVRGGHLKPEDLVWRPGFSDWLPATTAFPPAPAAPAPASLGPASHQATSGPAPQAGTTAGRASAEIAGHGQPQATAPAAAHQPRSAQPAPQPHQPAVQSPTAQNAPGAAQPTTRAHPSVTVTGPSGAGKAAAAGTANGPGAGPASAAAPGGRPAPGRSIVAIDRGGYGDEEIAENGGGRSRFGRVAIAATLLLAIAGGGWLTYQKRDSVKSMITGLVAGKSPAPTRPADPSAPAFVVEAGPADAIDARLQKTALWSVVKREFPEWYGERLAETAKLTAEKKPDAAVTRHLLEALVGLRRKHANDALAASSARLLNIADAFLANLKRIGSHNTTTCYSFISQGESSPAIIDLVQQRGTDTDLQAQVTAIFEAIAEGRKTPVKHAGPDKTDYDALAEQLTKLGWSQADLQLFADPRALARTSHDRVCKMVQDWFSAHIAVKDRGAQERLLIETLRPVVAG